MSQWSKGPIKIKILTLKEYSNIVAYKVMDKHKLIISLTLSLNRENAKWLKFICWRWRRKNVWRWAFKIWNHNSCFSNIEYLEHFEVKPCPVCVCQGCLECTQQTCRLLLCSLSQRAAQPYSLSPRESKIHLWWEIRSRSWNLCSVSDFFSVLYGYT